MLAISVFSAITDAIVSLKPAVMPRLDAPATPEAIMRAIRATTGGDMLMRGLARASSKRSTATAAPRW